MASFSLSRPLADPSAAWPEIVAHPELIWGHFAPDLVAGRSYQVISHSGGGAEGSIDSVQDGAVGFTWGRPGWPAAGRFAVAVGEELQITADALPDQMRDAGLAHWTAVAQGIAEYLNSRNARTDDPVAAVLFDADGVLQLPRDGWLDEFTRLGGPNFVVDAFTAELECLAGNRELRPTLERLLAEAGTGATVDEVLTVWHDIVVDPEALDLVRHLRRQGVLVGLATNQQSIRGGHMRRTGFDEHFDRTFYSYEVGHAKPFGEYFRHIVAELGVPADRIAFLDDAPANVVGARACGLRAALHRTSDGAAGLAASLTQMGVVVAIG